MEKFTSNLKGIFIHKTIGALLFLAINTCNTYAQISSSAYYNGYWGKWKKHYFIGYTGVDSDFNIYGNYSGFIVYDKASHPSEYKFKFQIDSYIKPTKDVVKYHKKNDLWFEYTGYVEYYIDNYYPTISEALRVYGFPCVTNTPTSIKKTSKATIKIAPYKDHPRLYNIFFENVGIAIDIGKWEFEQ